MGRKTEFFFSDSLQNKLIEAINNDFGKAVARLPNQGLGEIRDEAYIYFSALAMQQVDAISQKHKITDPEALHEIYQLMRTNLIQGFRIGQSMKGHWLPS